VFSYSNAKCFSLFVPPSLPGKEPADYHYPHYPSVQEFPFEIWCWLYSLTRLDGKFSIYVEAHRFVRKMNGGAQAHLIESVDGSFYVVKFTNNPQHPRVLINEWITSTVLRYLRIATPDAAVVNFSSRFIRDNPELHIQLGSGRAVPPCGSHFGSRFVGKPGRMIHPLQGGITMERIVNLPDFCGVLVVDKWLANTDSRQSVFVRVPGVRSPFSFVAHMIDNGQVFDGGNWRFEDSPLRGPYPDRVFHHVRGIEAFEPWLTIVATFPVDVLQGAFLQTPSSWRCGDTNAAFDALLDKLMGRRRRVRDLIYACRSQPTDPFPNWP